jgi:hypothetical protein
VLAKATVSNTLLMAEFATRLEFGVRRGGVLIYEMSRVSGARNPVIMQYSMRYFFKGLNHIFILFPFATPLHRAVYLDFAGLTVGVKVKPSKDLCPTRAQSKII